MARGPSKLNTRVTLVLMALFLALFVYEFVVRDSVPALPELPSSLAMLSAVIMPFALLMFGVQGMIRAQGLIARKRAGKEPWPRWMRALALWTVAAALGGAAYLTYQVSFPASVDDAVPDWVGMLVIPLGIASLFATLRAIAVSLGSGGPARSDADAVRG